MQLVANRDGEKFVVDVQLHSDGVINGSAIDAGDAVIFLVVYGSYAESIFEDGSVGHCSGGRVVGLRRGVESIYCRRQDEQGEDGLLQERVRRAIKAVREKRSLWGGVTVKGKIARKAVAVKEKSRNPF